MKKSLLIVVSVVLIAALTVGLTVAYFTSETETAVNVMVVGDIEIVQYEQERVDDNANQDELQDYTQGKHLWPAFYQGTSIPWAPADEWVSANDQAWKVVADNAAVIDKFVTVENTGADAAYVRTVFAIEIGTVEDYIHIVNNGTNIVGEPTWEWDFTAGTFELNGGKYLLAVATYSAPLESGVTTIPSLKQVYLDKVATQEECASLGDTFEIFAISQAVQVVGFDDPYTALNEAFGAINSNNHPWSTEAPVIPVFASKEGQVDGVLENGGIVYLLKDVPTLNEYTIADGKEVEIKLEENTLDGTLTNNGDLTVSNGKIDADYVENLGEATFTDVDMKAGTPYDYSNINLSGSVAEYNNVNIASAGGGVAAVDGAKVVFNSGSVDVSTTSTSGRYLFYAEGAGSEIVINDGTFSFSKTLNQKRAYVYAGTGTKVIINGGTFGPASTRSGYTAGLLGDGEIIITGGTFGFDPTNWVADGYKAVKTGNTWVVSAE